MKKIRRSSLLGRGKMKKVWRAGKMAFICVLLFNIQAFAYVSAQVLTMNVKNVSLEEVLLEIQKKSHFDIICNSEQVRSVKNISLQVEGATLEEVMKKCLEGTSLTYEISDKSIVIFEKQAVRAVPQSKTILIQGYVRDQDGQALPGAAVYLKNYHMVGTVTDADGRFSLPVAVGLIGEEKLVVAFVGMGTVEKLLQEEEYEFVLQPEATHLEDVVVTGYQTLSKERATGSFSVVTTKDLDQKLQPDIMSRLEGMVAGLTTYKGNLQIRGRSTISGNANPLYVVDGFPYEGDLSAINPAEITNITILKDATAASIYGARSANGVIVITTRKGTGKTTVEYNGSVVIRPLRDNRDYLRLMNSEELVDWQMEMFDIWHTPYQNIDKRYYQNEVAYLLYEHEAQHISGEELNRQLDVFRQRDNYEELKRNFLRSAVTHQHNLSLRGGSDRFQYAASVNYLQNLLQTQGQDNERIGFHLKTTYQFFPWLKADAGIMGSYTKADYDNGFSALSYLNGGRASYQTLYDEKGNPLKWYQVKSQSEIDRLIALGLNDESYYPLEEMHRKSYLSKSDYSNINLGINLKIMEGLTVDLKYQLEKTHGLTSQYYDPRAYEIRNQINNSSRVPGDGSIEHLVPEGGKIMENRNDRNSYTLRAQLNFDRTFGRKHEISAIIGAERRGVHSTGTYTVKYGYDKVNLSHKYLNEEILSTTQAGTEAINGSYTHSLNESPDTFSDREDRYVSFYGNASYAYDSRYALTGSVRIDQSNLFGTDPRYQYKPLWSVGVSWYLNHESFMEDVDWVNLLSLRVTKGINGNIAKDSGPYMIVDASGINSWTGEYSSQVVSPPNSGLRWERTNQTNIGLDFSILGNRLGGSVEYYSKNTSDLLGTVAVDPTSGWNALTMNYAEMYNHGYEVSLNSVNIQKDNFRWTTLLNFSYNKNRITELETSENSVYSYIRTVNQREGMAMGTLYSFRWAGLDEEGRPQVYKKDGSIAKSMTEAEVEDLVRSGTTVPLYAASMSNRLSYKDFDLSFMFIYYGGHVMRDVMPEYLTGQEFKTNVNRNVRNYWKSPEDSNDPSKSPAFLRNASSNITNLWYAADKHIRKANYIKLREITLSYSLSQPWLKKIHMAGMSIQAQVQNLWYWGSQKRNLDPEAWEGIALENITRRPLDPTIYTLGLSLKF